MSYELKAEGVSALLGVFAIFLLVVGCISNPRADIVFGDVPIGLSDADVQAAVLEGCDIRGWTCKAVDDETIAGSIWVRRKHYVEVKIVLSLNAFNIIYSDSENLEYNSDNNTIHGNYQGWVNNLKNEITNALFRKTE